MAATVELDWRGLVRKGTPLRARRKAGEVLRTCSNRESLQLSEPQLHGTEPSRRWPPPRAVTEGGNEKGKKFNELEERGTGHEPDFAVVRASAPPG